MSKKIEYLEIVVNRENLYRFLARVYKVEVDQSLLEQIKVINFPVECCEAQLNKGYKILREYLENCSIDSLNDLAVDYAKVFLGAGISEGSAAFPYESVYTSQKKIIMQEARDEVMSIYAAKGLKKNDAKSNFFEDHISLELEFMAFLCHEIQGALDTEKEEEILYSVKEQMDFLKQHLLNWVPKFCDDVEKYADTNFYKGIAKITNGYLHLDDTILESLMD